MYRALSETIKDPLATYTIEILKLLNLKISKTLVRTLFYNHFKDESKILIDQLQEILSQLGVHTFLCMAKRETLKDLEPPFLIELYDDEQEILLFKLVTKIDTGFVHIYNSNSKTTEKIEEAKILLKEKYLVIAVDYYDSTSQEILYESVIEKEENEKKEFLKTFKYIPHFIDPEICLSLIEYVESNNLFERSLVSKLDRSNNLWTGHSYVRTSYSADITAHASVNIFLKKINPYLNMPFEKIQQVICTRYMEKQQFKIHHDAADGDKRQKTIYIYLNDIEEGGEIYFPELDLKIEPKTGDCIFFNSLDEQQRRIPESLHASLPVKKGIKYELNLYAYAN